MGASACFRPGGGSQFEGYRLPDVSRLGSSFSRCAPEPTNPEVYAEHYAARAAACRRYHIGSLQKLLCPFWSPFATRGSIRGWVFCTPPSPGCRFVYILFVLFLSFP
jgi:hypothetical protein